MRRRTHPRASTGAAAVIPTHRSASPAEDNDGDAPPSPEKKLVIPLVTDANSPTLLRPPDSSRPVLVDAFAPWCGPCKLLDKVLRKAQPRYVDRIDFVRWNVNDAEGTSGLRDLLASNGHALSKLPSLVVFRDGSPVAMRPGFANEFQLDDFLERTLPDVLERTFDERGVKMIGLPMMMATSPPPSSAVAVEGAEERGETTTTTTTAAAADLLPPPPEGAMAALVFLEAKEACEVVGGGTEERCEIVVVEVEAASSATASSSSPADSAVDDDDEGDCDTPLECIVRLERTAWKNRTVVPAMDGIGSFLPARMATARAARS
jgi:thioredoxin 1